jgi:hypothetical protein
MALDQGRHAHGLPMVSDHALHEPDIRLDVALPRRCGLFGLGMQCGCQEEEQGAEGAEHGPEATYPLTGRGSLPGADVPSGRASNVTTLSPAAVDICIPGGMPYVCSVSR